MCILCGFAPGLKSNYGIISEYNRISSYLNPPPETSCANTDCDNHLKGITSNPTSYFKKGSTSYGAQRYQCKKCKKTFSINRNPLKKQKKSHKNLYVFNMLMNGMALRRVCKVAGIGPQTLYGKIDFFHKQALGFMGKHESTFFDNFSPDRIYLSTDRQRHVVNWTESNDKRNTHLEVIATADHSTGFVFALNINFDPSKDATEVENLAIQADDYSKPKAFREFGHLWLKEDYKNAHAINSEKKKPNENTTIFSDVKSNYERLLDRQVLDEVDDIDHRVKLPSKGMQVHNDYTMYAHFYHMNELLKNAGKVRFYMDHESGIRAAFMSMFEKRVKEETADSFYVKVKFKVDVHTKKRLVRDSKKRILKVMESNPEMSRYQAEKNLVAQAYRERQTVGMFKDLWINYPIATMDESEKMVCFLTDIGQYDDDHIAGLLLKSTLRPVDRVFLQIRNSARMFTRGVRTAADKHAVYYQHNAYNPLRIVQLLELFRFYYNYCEAGKDKKTPAMRLGLTTKVVNPQEVFYRYFG